MLKKTSSGYEVTSKSGKALSKPNLSKAEAMKRIRQVEWFKNHSGQAPTGSGKAGHHHPPKVNRK